MTLILRSITAQVNRKTKSLVPNRSYCSIPPPPPPEKELARAFRKWIITRFAGLTVGYTIAYFVIGNNVTSQARELQDEYLGLYEEFIDLVQKEGLSKAYETLVIELD